MEKAIESIPAPKIITGDFNAHATAWGCADDNIRGTMLLDILQTERLVYLNDGSIIRISPPPNRSSAIDLTICSDSFALNMYWYTLDSGFSSDHLPTITEIIFKCPIINQENPVYRYNWNKFSKIVESQAETIETSENIQMSYDSLCHVLQNALDNSKKLAKSHHSCPWWDEECELLYRNKISAFKTYVRNYKTEDFLCYIKANALAKKKFKSKKQECWNKFCSSTYEDNSLRSLYKMVGSFSSKKTK